MYVEASRIWWTWLTSSKYETVSGTYNVAATYCEPDSGPSSALQILTHGIGFDRSYWDLPFHNYNYSYVNEAVDQYGFSTFSWDRLGIAESEHADPISEVQALFEVDALRDLTEQIKAGEIMGVPKSFNKISHVGHSYGSQHTYALTAMYPDISDCITLQGFSQNGSFGSWFLLGGGFVSANTISALSDYPDGYLAGGDATAVQTEFFAPGDFDPDILAYGTMNGQPVTVGELLTFGGETASMNNFAGPVHIVTGERDIPYCGGNCFAAPTGYPTVPSTSADFIPNAEAFTVTISMLPVPRILVHLLTCLIVPGAGHGLNLQYSWPTTYASMLDYLVNHGCGPKGGD